LLSDYIPETRFSGCYYLGMLTAGFVLVGGQSRRMGRDKALLPWKKGVLVQEIAAKAAAAAGPVTLVGHPPGYAHLNLPCIPDLRPGLGPLSGIEAALASSHAELNLILACDMPLMNDAHLARLMETARNSSADCVVTADASGRLHPLLAVYRRACLPRIQSALDEGRLQLTALARDLRPELVPAAEDIVNVNSPAEWEALQRG
jgi:molybdopterin-guanine dinucleotide biosynthesis protein A